MRKLLLILLCLPLMTLAQQTYVPDDNFEAFLEANGILVKKPSNVEVSRSELGKQIIDGTLFLSCWMTYAKIQELKTEKVMFENLY